MQDSDSAAGARVVPMIRRKRRRVLMAIAAAMAMSAPAFAQRVSNAGRMQRVEVWGAGSVTFPGPTGTIVSSYAPPLLFDGAYVSRGAQLLAIDGNAGVGLQAGLNLFLTEHAGVQVIFDRKASTLSGANGPYALSLQYVGRPPPDNLPVPSTVASSSPWPNTSGSIAQTSVGINGVLRLAESSRVRGTVSGGLAYYRLAGSVEPLAFTAFHLGGHSVLFEDDYQLAAALDPSTALGFNAGGDVNVAVGRFAAVLIGYRYFEAPDVDMPIRVASVLNPASVTILQAPGDIQQFLAPAPARVTVGGSRVVVGLKLTF